MNFKVSKSRLYEALSSVSHAVSSNNPISSLKGIKIIATDEPSLIITGSDSDITIQYTLSNEKTEDLELMVNEPGGIVIDAKYILDIVHKIDSDYISVEIIDGALTLFKGNNAQFRINGIKTEDYPSIDLSKPATSIEFESDVLSEAIEETVFATSDKDTRPVLKGVNFVLADNKLLCIATDSFRLARKTIPFTSDASFNITVPSKSLNETRSILLSNNKTIGIAVNDKKIQFYTDSIILQSRLLDGGFPDTERLIPSSFTCTLTIPRSSLISVLDRSMFIKNDNMIINRLQCSEEDVIFSNRSQEIGDFTQSLISEGAKFEGEALDVSFSATYVMQAAKALKGDTVVFKFVGTMRPFILIDPEDDSILQLTLPIRTYN